MSLLKAEGLCKSYKGRQVVKEAGIEVSSGEVVGLLGPNGAGKTTIFYMVVGFTWPDAGSVFLDDKVITDVPMHKIFRGIVPFFVCMVICIVLLTLFPQIALPMYRVKNC